MVGSQTAQKILLLLASVCVALVAGELIARLAFPHVRGFHQHPSNLWRDDFIREERIGRYDPRLGWVLKPDSRTTHRSWEFEYDLATNSRGLRDEETSYERGPAPRLLLLGDSFAMGYGVEQELALESRLEESLGAEVVNLAVAGYGTDQELLSYELEGRKYNADLVLLLFTVDNDVLNNGGANQYGKNKPWFAWQDGTLELQGVPVPEEPFPAADEPDAAAGSPFPIHDFLDAASSLYAFVFDRLAQFPILRRRWEASELVFAQVDLFYASQVGMLRTRVGADSPVWKLTLALLDRWRIRCADAGAEPVLVLVPSQLQVYEESLARVFAQRGLNAAEFDANHPNRLLVEYGRARNLETVDLLPTLRAAAADGRRPYFRRNPHWNRVGHQLAADAIAARLRDRVEALRGVAR